MCYRTLREVAVPSLKCETSSQRRVLTTAKFPVLLQSIIKPLQEVHTRPARLAGNPAVCMVSPFGCRYRASVEGENTKVGESKIDYPH